MQARGQAAMRTRRRAHTPAGTEADFPALHHPCRRNQIPLVVRPHTSNILPANTSLEETEYHTEGNTLAMVRHSAEWTQSLQMNTLTLQTAAIFHLG